MRTFIVRYYKVILWTFIIAYLCFSPSDGFKKVNVNIRHLDKIIHFIMFFVLALLVAAIQWKAKLSIFNNSLVIMALLYGGIIELIQNYYIVSRSGDFIDWGADVMGIIAGILVFRVFPLFAKKLLA